LLATRSHPAIKYKLSEAKELLGMVLSNEAELKVLLPTAWKSCAT
jgi:hypothetical protein